MAALTTDWREFLSLLISHRVKFVVVGGHAVAVHARARTTEDLDVFVAASLANGRRLREVLVEFGFGEAAPDATLLATPGKVFMIGVPPFRIDVLTRISGVAFTRAWATRIRVDTEIGKVPFVGLAALVANKRAAGRPKDLADLALLGASPRSPGHPTTARKRTR